MSESNAPSSEEVKESLRLLRSADPADRRRGIAVLVALRDDPRVIQVFEHLYENDPDPGVRAAAYEALHEEEQGELESIPFEPAIPPVEPPPAAERATEERPAVVVEERPAVIVEQREVRETPRNATPAVHAAPEPPLRRVPEPPPREAPLVETEPIAAPVANGELFLLNPANAQFVGEQRRRMARGNNAGCVRYFLAAISFALAVALGVLVGFSWYEWYRLEEDGVATQGEITNLYQRDDGKYRAVYAFEVGQNSAPQTDENSAGLTYFDEQRIEGDDYYSLQEGDTVVVTYLPDDPSITRLQLENPDDELRDRLTIAAIGLLLLSLLLLILGAVRRRRARYLPNGGRLVRGELVSATGHPDSDGDFKVTARYRFRSPKNKEILQHHASQIRNDLRSRPLPAPGTPVAIVYKDDRSFSML